MSEFSFHKRNRPGVKQRHNTSLEHKIVRSFQPKPSRAPANIKKAVKPPVVPVSPETKARANRQLPGGLKPKKKKSPHRRLVETATEARGNGVSC